MATDDTTLERLLDSEEVGALYGLTARTIRNYVDRGVLPVVRIPGSRALRFRPSALAELAKRLEVAAVSPETNEVEL